MYWPTSALDDFADDFEEVSIGFEDDQAAAQLENMIIRQNTRLKEAKEKLRSLIKDSFSIEEILFQPESHSYR
jgi:phytoene/squalene synthetase